MATLTHREGGRHGRRPALHPCGPPGPPEYFPWIVFALTFGLLLSDYMSRQVLSAVFPFLKVEWALTDTQLGGADQRRRADRRPAGRPAVAARRPLGPGQVHRADGRRSGAWPPPGSALAANYEQLMLSRVFIGVGEAAYGSVGLAVVLAVFPAYRRASLTGAFMAGGSFGSVLGVALGGALAVQFGWRWSFAAMAILGLVLVVALPGCSISDKKLDAHRVDDLAEGEPVAAPGGRAKLRTLFSTPSVHRRLRRQRPAAVHRRLAVRLAAQLPRPRLRPRAGQGRRRRGDRDPVHGRRHDRLRCGHRPAEPARADPQVDDGHRLHGDLAGLPRRRASPCSRVARSCCCWRSASSSPPAPPARPVPWSSNLTHESIRATALGTLTLANNLLGLAAGPLVTGILADRFGLEGAMKIVPIVARRRAHRPADRPQVLPEQPRQGQRSVGHPMTAVAVLDDLRPNDIDALRNDIDDAVATPGRGARPRRCGPGCSPPVSGSAARCSPTSSCPRSASSPGRSRWACWPATPGCCPPGRGRRWAS